MRSAQRESLCPLWRRVKSLNPAHLNGLFDGSIINHNMIEKGRIYLVPFHVNLVNWLANQLKITNSRDMSGTAVVFPGKRPSWFLKKAISSRLRSEFIPPATFQSVEFYRFLHELIRPSTSPISQVDVAWLIYRLGRRSGLIPRPEGFDQFFFWGLKFADMFDELDAELVSDDQLAEVKDAMACDSPHFLQSVWQHVPELRNMLEAELRALNRITEGLMMRNVAENLDEIIPKVADRFEIVVFAGHFALRKSELRVVKRFLQEGVGAAVLHVDDMEKWPPIKKFIAEVGQPVVAVKASPTAPKIQLHETLNTHAEAIRVFQLLSAQGSRAKTPPPGDTAVVLPSESALMPLIHEAISPLGVQFNISMGYPFKRTPFFALIKSIFKAQETRREDGAYHAPDYLNLLLHPYIKNILIGGESAPLRIALHHIQDVVIGKGWRFIKIENIEDSNLAAEITAILSAAGYPELAEQVNETVRKIHEVFFRAFEDVSTVADATVALHNAIDMLLNSAPVKSYPLSGEFLSAMIDALHELENGLFVHEPLGRSSVFSFLLNRFAGLRVPFEGTPLSGLQVLGLLETRALNFQNVIVMDVNEGVLPSVEMEDPLLPMTLRRKLGLPDHRSREMVFKYHFFRLINGARNVHLLYRKGDGLIRSRFIEKLVWERELKERRIGAFEPEKASAFRLSVQPRRTFRIEKDDFYFRTLENREFSATAIDTYINCPLRFYLKYVMNLKEPGEIRTDVESNIIGSVIHEILADFYRKAFGIGKLIDWDREGLEGLLEAIIDEKFDAHFPEIRGDVFIIQELTKIRLSRFIEKESDSTPSGVYRLIHVEKKFRGEIEMESGLKVRLQGTFDRVDFDIQGHEFRIIDYKTGQTKMPGKELEEVVKFDRQFLKKGIKSLQLPLYIYLFRWNRGDVSWKELNAGLYSVPKAQFDTIFRDGRELREEKMENFFIPALKFVLAEIFDPGVPIEADESEPFYCRSCPYREICKNRVDVSFSGASSDDGR